MLRFFSIIFFLIHVACCTRQMQAQVINIESKRFYNDTNGWVGKADLHFSIMQNTQQVISMGNNVHLQYQKSNSRFLILNDISFIKAGTTDFVNSGFQHLRYNYKVFDKITLEVFSQAQYNRVLLLDLRYLNGIGPRFKLVKKEKFKLYTACLYMYEYEKISNTPAPHTYNRLSAYLTFSWVLGKTTDIACTTFYQPNFADTKDYRIANDSALEIVINKNLNYKTGFNLLFDTRQPESIPNLVYTLKNGLSFKF